MDNFNCCFDFNYFIDYISNYCFIDLELLLLKPINLITYQLITIIL